MFCPSDGRAIPYPQEGRSGSIVTYPPCEHCGVVWVYDAEEGVYRTLGTLCQAEEPPTLKHTVHHFDSRFEPPIMDDLDEVVARSALRGRSADAMVALVVDAMEKKAGAEGQSTYYTGTFAVARDTLVTCGLTCERDPGWRGNPPNPRLRWVSFFGDDWAYLTRKEAIQYLTGERS